MERKRLADVRKLPEPVKIVHGEGRMGPKGYIMENHAWLPYLTTRVNGRRIGLDPKRVKPTILEASGHPPKSATTRIRHYLRWIEKDRDPKTDRGLKRLRKLCLECADGVLDVKNCACIDCPLWVHRLGSNPHTFHIRRSR